MSTSPKDEAAPHQLIVHAQMQKVFNQHRHKFDRHRAKGGAFAQALDDLEERLFGPDSRLSS